MVVERYAVKAITIRNITEDLYNAVVRLAQLNRRSIQQQVIILLERARQLDTEPPPDRARSIRERLSGRPLGDTVQELRAERQR